ncbi:MAG: kinase/pyrophosphorylase [Nitrospirae bacterium]|nr:kinase/pyrophosphorylase [Nitrospirota bacterium]
MVDYTFFAVSDGTGKTAKGVIESALVQFEADNVTVRVIPEVNTEEKVRYVVAEASGSKTVIVYTIVSQQLRDLLFHDAHKSGIQTVDVLGPILSRFEGFLGLSPKSVPGIYKPLSSEYEARIEAINFTVDHDDGQGLSTIGESDIIILGVSRSSKTPLSIYLASHGWKVSNVPIVQGINPPEELKHIRNKTVCLIIQPERLADIRKVRAKQFGMMQQTDYSTIQSVFEEIEFAREFFRRHPSWPVIDVTYKSVEEIALEVITSLDMENNLSL